MPTVKFSATSEEYSTAEAAAEALNDFIKLAPEDRGPAQEMIELFFTCGRENSADSRDENDREIEERGAVIVAQTPVHNYLNPLVLKKKSSCTAFIQLHGGVQVNKGKQTNQQQ